MNSSKFHVPSSELAARALLRLVFNLERGTRNAKP